MDGTARLAAMNLILHGIGSPSGESLIEVKHALIADPGTRWSVVLWSPRPTSSSTSCSTSPPSWTMLRLPTGIFYAQGVKANVLVRKPAADRAWTERLWVYDLRTNQHFTLKKKTLRREHLQDFVDCYALGKDRTERVETERFRAFTYDELMACDEANLDITRLRDESLEDLDNLPAPEVIAREIVEDLTAALVEFEAVAAALEAASTLE